MLPTKLAFVDIETTGLGVTHDRIIEIGILRVENNKLIESYQTLVNPQMYISPFVEELTGIKKSDLEHAPLFEDIKDQIYELLDDAVFVAHNARFDYGFIRNEFRRVDTSFSAKQCCTVKLAKKLFPRFPRYNLDTIIQQFSLNCEHRHRAFDDAKVLWDFYQKLQEKLAIEDIEKGLTSVMNRPALPTHLSTTIDELPEQPGVYIFYGTDGVPLYVGKSKNIRERVISHFHSDYQAAREMNLCQQVQSIEAFPTAGELSALINESRLVKTMQPLFNRKLRIARKLILLTTQESSDGYDEVSMKEVDSILPTDVMSILGLFKSKKQAKNALSNLAKEYQLCEKLLGLEKTKGACFSYRLGFCKGACIGKEHPLQYKMRFVSAFTARKIKAWPFSGPISINEKNELTGKEEQFIIDRWCLLSDQQDQTFDYDVYKIIVRYIHEEKNLKNIKIISESTFSSMSSISN